MAKSKERKPHPKAPETAKTVIEIKKTIDERKTKLAKAQEAATKEGKLDKFNPKYRLAIKRLKRSQRKLLSEAYRLKPKKAVVPAEAAAAPAAGTAPAEGEKK